MRKFVALITGLLAGQACAAVPPVPTAKGFVTGLYESYQHPDVFSSLAPAFEGKIFSPSLLILIRADQHQPPGNVGKLDFDPVCDCQDPDGLKLIKIVAPAAVGRLSAVATFSLGGRIRIIHLDLADTDAGWRVDDISSPDVGSLRRFLAAK